MKPIKCELWVGTSTSFFKLKQFDSISEAKRYVKSCINFYHELRII